MRAQKGVRESGAPASRCRCCALPARWLTRRAESTAADSRLVGCAALLTVLSLPLSSVRGPARDWGNPETFGALVEHLQARSIVEAYAERILPSSLTLWQVGLEATVANLTEDLINLKTEMNTKLDHIHHEVCQVKMGVQEEIASLRKSGVAPDHPSLERAFAFLDGVTPDKTYAIGCMLLAIGCASSTHGQHAVEA